MQTASRIIVWGEPNQRTLETDSSSSQSSIEPRLRTTELVEQFCMADVYFGEIYSAVLVLLLQFGESYLKSLLDVNKHLCAYLFPIFFTFHENCHSNHFGSD